MNRIELWRRREKLKQREVAGRLGCTDIVIVRAERGDPIRPKYRDALIVLSGGQLKVRDFAASPKRKHNGKT